MFISTSVFIFIIILVVSLVVVSLSLGFKLRDIISRYNKDMYESARKGFYNAMNVRINEEDAFHLGYIKAMQEMNSNKEFLSEDIQSNLEERLGGGEK